MEAHAPCYEIRRTGADARSQFSAALKLCPRLAACPPRDLSGSRPMVSRSHTAPVLASNVRHSECSVLVTGLGSKMHFSSQLPLRTSTTSVQTRQEAKNIVLLVCSAVPVPLWAGETSSLFICQCRSCFLEGCLSSWAPRSLSDGHRRR